MTDDNNIDKEKIKLLEEQTRLYVKQLALQEEGYSLSTSYIESLKEVLGITSKLSTGESNLLNLNKKINKEILNQKLGLNRALDVQKQITKNNELLNKSKILTENLSKIANENAINAAAKELKNINDLQSQREKIFQDLQEQDNLTEDDISYNKIILDQIDKEISKNEENLNFINKSLSSIDKQVLYTKLQNEQLDKLNEKQKEHLKYLTDREKSLGVAGKLTKALSDLPGLGKIFGDPEYLDAINEKLDNEYTKTKKFPGLIKTLGIQLGTAGKMLLKTFADPTVYLGLMLKGFLSLNKAQTDFQKETGRTIAHFDTFNTSLISSSDYIKQATALTKQFGFAADLIFTSDTLQEATELVELMGLSAEQAGKLAMYSKISGKDLKSTNENIVKYVSNFNKANKTAISQKLILQDVASVSNEIAIKFGGNPEKIAAAATEARKLGLTLEGVDRVAGSLLDFESSISNELSAELLTGKELNLEKARLYALNEDLAGLTKEIGNNEEIISAYTQGNRIQREAIAASIGMSKEDLASMIYQQQLQNGLTQEQAAAAAGVTLEDMKRLSVQESLNKSIEKMGEALAGPLEMIAKILSNTIVFKSIIGLIVGVQLVKMIVLFGQLVSTAKMLRGLEIGAAVAKGWDAAMSSPASRITGGIAGLALGAIITAAIMSSVNNASKPQMAEGGIILPTSGGTDVTVGEAGSAEAIIPLNTPKANKYLNGGNNQDMTAILNKLDALANRPVQVNTQLNMDGAVIAKGTSRYADKMGTNFNNNTYTIS